MWKTTFLRVLAGLLPMNSGNVRWRGRSIKDLSRSSLIQVVACVMQDDQIFRGTILQNISHFDPAPDMKRIEKICEESGVSSYLDRLPMGLYTQVSSGAPLLSAGERQILFLERALFLETPALILDEFSGNLDLEVESRIFDFFQANGRAIILTTHRKETLARATGTLSFGRNML